MLVFQNAPAKLSQGLSTKMCNVGIAGYRSLFNSMQTTIATR